MDSVANCAAATACTASTYWRLGCKDQPPTNSLVIASAARYLALASRSCTVVYSLLAHLCPQQRFVQLSRRFPPGFPEGVCANLALVDPLRFSSKSIVNGLNRTVFFRSYALGLLCSVPCTRLPLDTAGSWGIHFLSWRIFLCLQARAPLPWLWKLDLRGSY